VFDGVRTALAGAPLPVLAAWAYGSVARGQDTVASDLDMAVVFDVRDGAVSNGVVSDGAAARRDTGSGVGVETALVALREGLAPLEEAQHVTLSLVGLSRDDVARLSAGDPWWTAVARDAVPLVGPAPSALAARLGAVRRAAPTQTTAATTSGAPPRRGGEPAGAAAEGTSAAARVRRRM
jgi:hypothetical protein